MKIVLCKNFFFSHPFTQNQFIQNFFNLKISVMNSAIAVSFAKLQLESKFENPKTTLKDALEMPNILVIFRSNVKGCQDFFIKHAHELLRYCLSDDRTIQSTRAIEIIQVGNIPLLEALFIENAFPNELEVILRGNFTDSAKVSMVGAITLLAIIHLPEQGKKLLFLISSLFDKITNLSIFNMFQKICSKRCNCENVYQWFKTHHFPTMLLTAIQNLYQNHRQDIMEKNYLNENYLKTSYYFQLLELCLENPSIFPLFNQNNVLSVLLFQIVPNERWSSIIAFARENNNQMMIPFIHEAINILSGEISYIEQYHTLALTFLTKMINFDPNIFQLLDDYHLFEFLLLKILQFPYVTELHLVFHNFVSECLKHQNITMHIIKLYLPFLVNAARNDANKVFRNSAAILVQKITELSQNWKELSISIKEDPDYNEYTQKDMSEYMNLCKKDYGEMTSNIFKKMFK